MDAERANRLSDPNDAFVNHPGGEFGTDGSGLMNLMGYINDSMAALHRWIRRRLTR
jgi:hypothetical protein